jgi:RNA recognition motif-containing protein
MVLVRHMQEVPTSLSNSSTSLNSIETCTQNYHYQYNNHQQQQQQQQQIYNNTMPSLVNTNEQRTVYLGDLDMNITEKQLHEHFHSLGITTTKITKQPHSSYAHVTFATIDMARKCLDASLINLGRNGLSTTTNTNANSKAARVLPFNQPNTFDPNANLIIKNLESHLTETDIIEKMKAFGDILSCKLVRDERTGESKCYSYLQYKEPASAAEAIDKLNNTYWDEKCDPDYKYRMFQERLALLKSSIGKLHESDLQEHQLFADFAHQKLGKKIYVGLFKKKDEYTRIKTDKEGKPSNLYVKNFGTSFGDRDLFNLFKAYGSIKSAKVRRLKTGLVEKPLGW